MAFTGTDIPYNASSTFYNTNGNKNTSPAAAASALDAVLAAGNNTGGLPIVNGTGGLQLMLDGAQNSAYFTNTLSNSKLGVNTSFPQHALDVAGTIYSSSQVLINGTVFQSSVIDNTAAGSDFEIKTDVASYNVVFTCKEIVANGFTGFTGSHVVGAHTFQVQNGLIVAITP